jgi:phosphomannomutase
MSNPGGNLLAAELDYKPVPLKFGTSGRRGPVIHLTQLEVYINAFADLEYLQSLPESAGGIRRGDEFYFAFDLRPSSSQFIPELGGRGELAQAVERAISDSGMRAVNLGRIPTPALTYHALQRHRGSMMITGSHIPFDLNGYKTNSAIGELTKADEAPIHQMVERVRERLYSQPLEDSLFNRDGQFRCGHVDLSPERNDGHDGYLERYADFFKASTLAGKRILVYQHSAVGRDLLVEQLRAFGAEVMPAGRSETFVPIDTENINADLVKDLEILAGEAAEQYGSLDAVVSTDGDSDRPMILGVASSRENKSGRHDCRLRFFPGDLVGMVVAQVLGADSVVVPISCNDAVDRGLLRDVVEPKTQIGSPYVIAGIEAARAKGRKQICGWEANGGFLLGSDLQRNGRLLKALVTRDAVLPILEVLFASVEQGVSLDALFGRLPQRFGCAGLLKNFPRDDSRRILRRFSPSSEDMRDVRFKGEGPTFFNSRHQEVPQPEGEITTMSDIRNRLGQLFGPDAGFGKIIRLNYTDGLRIYFENGDIAHVRPSGNADELRIYAVADTQGRADSIVATGIAEPNGILRQLHG